MPIRESGRSKRVRRNKTSRHSVRGRRTIQMCIVSALAFGVYANTLFNGFVDDDEAQVLRNPWITDVRFIPDIFSKSVWSFLRGVGVNNYYRPLMHIIYLVNYHLFGLQAWGFHLVNVLFHVANTILVLLIAARLTAGDDASGAEGKGRFAAILLSVPFVAALLFATHPVHTEAVAWVASVPELSCTCLYLLSFYLYISATDNSALKKRLVPSPPRKRGSRSPQETWIAFAGMTVETVNGSLQRPGRSKTRLALAAVCFFLALLCKETALTLPAVLLVYDLALERNERSLVERAAEYTPCLLAAAVYLMVRYRVLWATLVPATRLWNLSSYELAINVLPLFSQYARMLIVPIGLKFWHSFQPISSLLTVTGICSVVTVSAFLCAAVLAWMKHRLSFLCLALFVLPLCPALFISALPMKPLAERYLYLPSAGFVILAALALSRLSTVKGMRIVALAAAVALTSVYSAATIRRNRVWQSAYTLFADTVKQAPDAQIPRYDLAIALANQGRVDEAMEHYRILVGANPNYAAAQSAYGSALLLKGRLDEAIEHLTTALSLDPSSLESYNDLAIALRKKGEVQEAIAQYRKALAIDPEYADAHFNLASALADTGHIHEAMEHYRAAVRLKPENAYYRNVIGIEYGKLGLLDEAIEQFREAVRLAPSEPAYTRNLERARALKRSGQPPSEIAK